MSKHFLSQLASAELDKKENVVKRILVAALVVPTLALAAETSRIITVSGGVRQGNLRTGPYAYSGGVKGQVQDLAITAQTATLTAPQGVDMASAEGKRVATFEGGVTVRRNRLTATGPSLEYRESTGVGTLRGPTRAVNKPEKAEDDEVVITGSQAVFDVDADTSTSKGNVKIVSGKQNGQADIVIFEEKRGLAVLTDEGLVSLLRDPKKQGDPRIQITAKEVRLLTNEKLLMAQGTVTLISGDNVTTGTALYYDDSKDTAYVIGRPAKNVNKRTGDEVTGNTLVNNTKKNQVQIGKPFTIPVEKFKRTGEK